MRKSNAPANEGPVVSTQGAGWRTALTGTAAAAAVLALFWVVMVASLRDKSLTYDEVVHAAAGYSYWHYSDYRLQPENGQLPQRVAGLPMALSIAPLPEPDPAAWRDAEQWQVGYQWLYRSGADAAGLAMEGRMCCGLFAVALGALVWAWSRSIFGPLGAMTSLVLFVLSPTLLANGALMTSDTAAALFLAAAAWGMWALLDRFTALRLLLSAFLVGALFLTKVSALLIGPVALLLIGARLADGRPLPVSIGGRRRELASRPRQALAFAGAFAVHAVVVVAVIWAAYGFRYSAFADAGPSGGRFRLPWEYLLAKPDPVRTLLSLNLGEEKRFKVQAVLASNGASEPVWTNHSLDAMGIIRREVLSPEEAARFDAIQARPSPELWVRMIEAARRHELLPEAWIYGFTDVYRRSQVRPAFLNGEFRLRGWPWFFPYTFLVKTPLALFAVIGLALAAVDWQGGRAGGRRWRAAWERMYPALPLWALFALYWAAAVAGHLNIGHRHLIPVLAPLFILCGVSARWIEAALGPRDAAVSGSRKVARAAAIALVALLACLAAGDARFFPNYLAYFNGIVAPRDAYRHLVDSSLDWGQDLPAARAFLDRHQGDGPAYFSYFGAASPAYYGIRAFPLYSVAGLDEMRTPDLKYLFMSPEDAAATLPTLRDEWPDHELLGAQRVGGSVVATLIRKPGRLSLHAGTYLISASMLQPVNFPLSGPWGPWNARYEATYQQLDAAVKPLMGEDREARIAALGRRRNGEWLDILQRFEQYRFGRLTAFLRQREPDDEINFSIMVYRVTDAELARALEGPPPPFGPDARAAEMPRLPPEGGDGPP